MVDTPIPFSKLIPLIKDVNDIFNKVMNLYNTAQHSKKKIKLLIERIGTANSAVSILREENLYTLHYYNNLQRLIQVLQKMRKYIEELIQYNKMKKLLKSKSIKKMFKDLCEEYDMSIRLLNLINFETLNETLKEDVKELYEVLQKDIRGLFNFQEALAKSIIDTNVKVTDTSKKITDMNENVNFTNNQWIENAIKERLIKNIEWNELTNLSGVGSGHFGSVSKAYWSKTNDYVVFKKSNDIQNQNQAFQHEIQMQLRAHACENIIRFLGITQEPQNNKYCIVMEFAEGGDLRNYLYENFSLLNWDKKYQLAFDITNGVHYLHKENILHRDLHAKNIVIQKGKAKITDFGYAKSVETQTMIHKGVFGMKMDIYSLGILLWELSSGYPPFKDQNERVLIINIVYQGLRERIIKDTPFDYFNLYTACWNGNPEERPIIEDVYDKLKCMLNKDDDNDNSSLIDNSQFTKSTMVNFNNPDIFNNLSLK
ncbi:kinase-like domain-containing protein [Glomus cerebriforme]|uniref:Kinase-like domain-containing protein n=1 Tax=Glomus cerebriforme TaxID=658196 RepID=A0A397TP02_9GLOM|nr:kinase-like domain-containing protein [Glomus cerebriforme]